MPPDFSRATLLRRLARQPDWDLIVIGGGASGLGVALDASGRGYRTLLLERHDFAKGTSSRSTKLVHGGVRYLAQGQLGLVREALLERGRLLRNAPHLVQAQRFIIPACHRWERPWYGLGLMLYERLAGDLGLGRPRWLSQAETLRELPGVRPAGLRGGISYSDAQFDDARLAVNLAQTCLELGALVLNHCGVRAVLHDARGQVVGVEAEDAETGCRYQLRAPAVVNATGIFADDVRRLDQPAAAPLLRPSQGVHLVLDATFLPGAAALMIPRTDDGRVLFAVPWQGSVVLGTTDTPLSAISEEPRALPAEVDFILHTAARYLSRPPRPADVRCVYAGLRPLAAGGAGQATRDLSRRHRVVVSPAGLVSLTGGKWTTFRQMGQDTIDQLIGRGRLPSRPSSSARQLIHGALPAAASAPGGAWAAPGSYLARYGTDQAALAALIRAEPALAQPLVPGLDYRQAEVVWAARAELARTVEDVLARRVRLLFHDARAALAAAPTVAALLGRELGHDEGWQQRQLAEFGQLARGYLLET
ncbi:FAD-dependent oxidoreductase [Hymenobacter sp. B81]|uniref:glycerol-3-phosphate dehydrogenase/oxidase n=1 Tax=Hymenobacter sp. B81 TaxID=3344878 RepID=UPI0037DCD1DC